MLFEAYVNIVAVMLNSPNLDIRYSMNNQITSEDSEAVLLRVLGHRQAMAAGVVASGPSRFLDMSRLSALATMIVLALVAVVAGGDWAHTVEAQSGPPAQHLTTCQTQVKQTSTSTGFLTGDLANDCAWLLSAEITLEGVNNGDALNWGETNTLDQWTGLTLSGSPARVTAIEPGESGPPIDLRGTLPSDLGNLTSLNSLKLREAKISGTIPKSIIDLTSQNLATLRLVRTNLTGPIPSPSSNPTALEELTLTYGNFSGAIPAFLCNATALEDLILDHNAFSDQIPSCLGSLVSLKYLDLSFNGLTGTIPTELGNLDSMNSLNLENNMLDGAIPLALAGMDKLSRLNLQHNKLTGTIPTALGQSSTLTTLELNNNLLTGEIPSELVNNNLSHIFLSNNLLTGEIPEEFGNAGTLIYLFLNGNRLSGEIPREWGARSVYIDFSENDLSGTIPPSLANSVNLHYLRLNNNRLTGTIPATVGNKTGLLDLHLHNNNLEGPIPFAIADGFTVTRFLSLRLDMEQIPDGELNLRLGDGGLPVHVEFDGTKIPTGADKDTSFIAIEGEAYIHLDPILLHPITPDDTHLYHDHYQEWEIAHKTAQPFGFNIIENHEYHIYVSLRAHDALGEPVFGDLTSPATVCLGDYGDLPEGSYRTLIHYIDHDTGWHPVHRPATVPARFTDDDACGEVDDISGYSVFTRGIGPRPPVDQVLNASKDTDVVVRIGDTTVYVHVPAGAASTGSRLSIAASNSTDRPTMANGQTISSDRTMVDVDITDANGQDVNTLALPATVCMSLPADQKDNQAIYHFGDSISSRWERLTPPDIAALPKGYREDFACGQTQELSKFVTGTTVNISNPKILRISPQIRSVTVSPRDQVRLGVDVYGMQDILDNELGNNVAFEWTATPSEGSIEESVPGTDDDSVPDEREVIFTAPSSAGRYVLQAALDSWECAYNDDKSDDCVAEIEVVVRRPSQPLEPTQVPANPDGQIPSIITDPDGNQHEVFTPEEGGNFIGEDVTVSAEPGAVPNGEIIGVRADVAGTASNAGQTHHRVTLDGNYYTLSAVDASGQPLSGYLLDDPVTVCIPLPSRLAPNISEVAMVSAHDDGTFTMLSPKVKITSDGVVLCGALSELSATIAAAHTGPPSTLPTPTPAPAPTPETPDTGGASPSAAVILWIILLGTATATLSALILNGRKKAGV